jgi:hypothetical protein
MKVIKLNHTKKMFLILRLTDEKYGLNSNLTLVINTERLTATLATQY